MDQDLRQDVMRVPHSVWMSPFSPGNIRTDDVEAKLNVTADSVVVGESYEANPTILMLFYDFQEDMLR